MFSTQQHILLFIKAAFICLVLFCSSQTFAQVPVDGNDSTKVGGKIKIFKADSFQSTADTSKTSMAADSSGLKKKKNKADYRYHSPVKATWMSAALPSLGQFYNRRYWKPPIIYVGLGVALYFLIDNQVKFTVARNSYRGRLNVPGFSVDPKYASFSADQILAERDFYRSNRDYSIIGLTLVYVLNVVDAAVDAHLRTFDVSDDLSMKIKPSFRFIPTGTASLVMPNTGISLALKF